MKAILLASFGTLVYLVLVTLVFRLSKPRSRALAMLKLFVATLPVFVLVHLTTPPDLGLLPAFATEPNWWVDLGFGLFVYAAGFFGGTLQLYNLAERGFSLRILMDIVESPAGMTLADVRRGYSRGRGIDWMFEKRLADMRAGEMISIKDGIVEGQARGIRVGNIAGWVRELLRLENQV